MFSTALIDFDGTICDTRGAISACLTKTLEGFSPDASRIDEVIASGMDLKRTLYELTGAVEPDIEQLVLTYRKYYNSEFGLGESRLFEGVVPFFRELADRKIKAIVVSNKGIVAIERALAHFRLEQYLCGVIADTGEGGPKHVPEYCLQQLKALLGDASMEKVLLIGDTVADVDFARHIGVRVACVDYGYGDASLIKARNPDYSINELLDLLAVFQPSTAKSYSEGVGSS